MKKEIYVLLDEATVKNIDIEEWYDTLIAYNWTWCGEILTGPRKSAFTNYLIGDHGRVCIRFAHYTESENEDYFQFVLDRMIRNAYQYTFSFTNFKTVEELLKFLDSYFKR